MSFWVILGHFGSFWVILGHFGSFLVILGHFGPFRVILGHFGSFLGHFGPFWVIFGLFWVINNDSLWVIFGAFSVLFFLGQKCISAIFLTFCISVCGFSMCPMHWHWLPAKWWHKRGKYGPLIPTLLLLTPHPTCPHSASQGEWYLKGSPSHNCAAQPYTGPQGAAPLQPDRALLLHNHRLCTEMIF